MAVPYNYKQPRAVGVTTVRVRADELRQPLFGSLINLFSVLAQLIPCETWRVGQFALSTSKFHANSDPCQMSQDCAYFWLILGLWQATQTYFYVALCALYSKHSKTQYGKIDAGAYMNEWISMKETSELLGLTPNTVRRLIRDGVLPAYEIKGVRGYQIKRTDVEGLITPVKVKPAKKKKL
jgi:excisionase family DNA binding protein